MIPFVAISLLALATLVQGSLFTDPTKLPATSYDFIIIGAGTAGSVIATRLSEDSSVRVLVVEAGISDSEGPTSDIQVPFLVSKALPSTVYDWNYTTVPQTGLNGRQLFYPRGFVVGGCSTVNFMGFTRGSSDEYDRIARVSGDSGWSWKNIFKYALKGEQHVDDVDDPDTAGRFNPAVHGHGPLKTSLAGFPTAAVDARVINTTQELKEFPFNLDMNSGNPLGVGWLQSTIDKNVRSSSATAYLHPALKTGTNIDVLIHSRVSRVLQTGTKDGLPVFLGVEITQSRNSHTLKLTARTEVILAAGAIGTPQILMLSGIGGKSELSRIGVKPLVDLPDVGKNMHDHPYITLAWAVNNTNTIDSISFNQTAFQQALAQYDANGTGVFASNALFNQLGFFRLQNASGVTQKFGDPTAGPLSPHYEFALSNGFLGAAQRPPTSGNFFSSAVILVSPTSRGSVVLNSSSIFDPPTIDPAFFTTAFDIAAMTEAIRSLQRFVSGSPWKSYLGLQWLPDGLNTSTDAQIENYVRSSAISVNHACCTAMISEDGANGGVVGSDLRVKGTSGLRIVDASILPNVPGAHPQAEIYIIAERAADLIKQSSRIRY
ncbi:aryl-alcohol oxidase-like protein [Mycena metata]|uniref:Aryl-alcohol oxidase-like protein n=1 Tax=Mycena metata TaxID=1033252 RepID=A0AAD7IUL5_9AGAR|nr:aryl-alcohol oxidase-like protein [Mycena metata]